MSIRRLARSDAADMARLHAASFDQGWPTADMESHIDKDIALGSGRLDGFILIRMAADQCEVLTIAVDKRQQQQGLGRKLLAAGEAEALEAGAEILFLEVAEDNFAAIALYKRAGFESFGRRPAYYKRPDGRVAARLFRKNLRTSI